MFKDLTSMELWEASETVPGNGSGEGSGVRLDYFPGLTSLAIGRTGQFDEVKLGSF